jgi:hypothetical protein
VKDLLTSYKGNAYVANLERRVGTRVADLYCTLRQSTENVSVEVQKSPISVNQLISRTEDYNDRNVSVLWLLYAKGDVAREPKQPKSRENVKISTAERFLHMLYGGRVYYVDYSHTSQEQSALMYALHYSVSSKRRYRDKRFYDGYAYYYIMNQDYIPLDSYSLCTTTFNGYGLARFFDKNLVKSLQYDILRYLREEHPGVKNKSLVKAVKNRFDTKTESVIEHALFNLYREGKIPIKKRTLRRSLRHYYSKYHP